MKMKATLTLAILLILGCSIETKAAEDTFVPAKDVSTKPEKVTTAKVADDAKPADKAAPAAKDADAGKKTADAAPKKAEEKSSGWSSKAGAELWAQDCRQCHNVRSPATLSSVQWENAMAFMRFRCNLTAKEYRKIAAFLQAASAH